MQQHHMVSNHNPPAQQMIMISVGLTGIYKIFLDQSSGPDVLGWEDQGCEKAVK